MMTMKLALLLFFLPLSAATTAFKYQNDMTCDNGVSVSNVAITCNGEYDTCALGDEATVTGTMVFGNEMPTNVKLTYEICFMYLYCKDYDTSIDDLCSKFGLQGTSGETCAAAGTYSFDASFKIPGAPSSYMSGACDFLSLR
jgi:hypothetical protein